MKLKRTNLPGSGASHSTRASSAMALRSGQRSLMAGIALASFLAFPFASAGARKPKPPMVETRKNKIKDFDWQRTHLLIINGDAESHHLENADRAAGIGVENGAASLHLAGLAGDIPQGVTHYNGDSSGIDEMFRIVGEASKSGDTIFIYLTGHGKEEVFVLERMEYLEHQKFLGLLEKHLSRRTLIFVSDACFSADFVDLLMESNKFRGITAMSPGLQDELTSCIYFAHPFWHAVQKGLDIDGNGVSTLEEAFNFAMKKYRLVKPDTTGTYRQSISELYRLEDVQNGVVMVTSEYCPACKMMEPIFNKAKLILSGREEFYTIDMNNAKHEDGTPALLIMRDGKVVAKAEGAKKFGQFSDWLEKHGISMDKQKISIKKLYKEGRYDSIVSVFTWDEMVDELWSKKALEVLTVALKDPDRKVRARAAMGLSNATTDFDLTKRKGLMEDLAELMGDSDLNTRWNASLALTRMAVKNPRKVLPYLRKLMDSRDSKVRAATAVALVVASKEAKIKKSGLSLKGLFKEGKYESIVCVYKWEEMNKALGPAKAIDVLLTSIKHEDTYVRNYAAGTLKKAAKEKDLTQHEGAMEGLKALLADEHDPTRIIASKTWLSVAKGNPDIAIPYMGEMLYSENKYIRGYITFPLWYASKEVDLNQYEGIIDGLRDALLDGSDDGLRAISAYALADAATDVDLTIFEGIPVSLLSLLDDEKKETRQRARLALARTAERNPHAMMDFIKDLLQERDTHNADSAIDILSKAVEINPETIMPHLKGLLEDSNPDIMIGAMWALSDATKKDLDRFAPLLMELLSDVNPDVRLGAIFALRNASETKDLLKPKGLVEAIECLRDDENPDVRMLALHTLEEVESRQD